MAREIEATIRNPISGYEWVVNGEVVSTYNEDSTDTTRYHIKDDGRDYVFFCSDTKKVLVDGTPAKYTDFGVQ